jgi:hypothetical protein
VPTAMPLLFFRLLGFQIADADRRREELHIKFGIPYNTTSLNDPLGLLKALNRILQP